MPNPKLIQRAKYLLPKYVRIETFVTNLGEEPHPNHLLESTTEQFWSKEQLNGHDRTKPHIKSIISFAHILVYM